MLNFDNQLLRRFLLYQKTTENDLTSLIIALTALIALKGLINAVVNLKLHIVK